MFIYGCWPTAQSTKSLLCDAELGIRIGLEFADLQQDFLAKETFDGNNLVSFWLGIDDKYIHFKKLARKILVRFGTTWVCESGFSYMVMVKTRYRNRITNKHLNDNLICALTSYDPRYEKLVKSKHNL